MIELNDNQFKPDFEIADKYISFSSEIMRISLMGITGIATFLMFCLEKDILNKVPITKLTENLVITSIICLTICTGFCLAHRFFATDSLAYLVANLRKNNIDEKKGLRKMLKISAIMLISAELCFAFGIFSFIVAVLNLL